MPEPIKIRGLWFEEFEEGVTIETRARTITEADIVAFAGISGDYNPMHTDSEYAAKTQFGARVAHGALVFSVVTGLLYQTNVLEDTVIAFIEFNMKLRKPIYIGDTIKVVGKVSGSRKMAAAGGGLVTIDLKVNNQKGETAQKGELIVMVKSKPDADALTSNPS
ncbi:MAG: MaoC family dehydratase N-terminal domain-containing protein [Anaerolineae bacterium]|nr:MaoC family dehydratase N-terminal domain-containing protein [Anaerolineae bacterium]